MDIIATVGSKLSTSDIMGMLKMRLGIGRNNYRVKPGLYRVGSPNKSSPVFVSANYKMSFDILRKELSGLNVWILVLNTRGINVWCAAGKGTFSTNEIVKMTQTTNLTMFVDHRELIVPQLGAPGVSAHEVAKNSGFRVVYGPVRAEDIKDFLNNGKKADPEMRTVTFGIWERFVLTPIELTSRVEKSAFIFVAILIISSISRNFFSFQETVDRGSFGFASYLIGLFSGGLITPLLLPWIPGRRFSLKGAEVGLCLSLLFCLTFKAQLSLMAMLSILLFSTSVSSYVALNFTGASPYTSPTGVEKEMRDSIPIQIIAVIVATIIWIANSFIGGSI